MSLNLKSRRLRRRKTASAPKPEPRLEAYDDAISSSATSPTAPSIFSKTSDEELHCKIESDTDTPSHTPFATVPGTPADTDDHRLPFLSDKDHTTADLSSLGQAIENSTRIDRTPGHASDAMGPDNLALEDEFVRLLLRSAARGSKTSKLCSFGVWKDEWPVYWEGAGLAAKGSW